ncbi:RNI-like protein [Patellaria atrata CBS 101060]|uniref:RNI-like protein n=1 Tax=Patellaria atrata CBS 101060 TaxID=1346257 RepID=A0A9P4S309_9PEZI|nr:RNI-like protein [Patellaria atrata CBS 101060]
MEGITPLSIDAVVHTSGSVTPTSPYLPISDAIPIQRPKMRGRDRLFQSLQRISSSPSLAKMGRTPSTGYRGSGKGSISCVSLSSSPSSYGHSYNSSYSSGFSAGFSTAPTSVSSTPGPDTPYYDSKTRIRTVAPGSTVTSVPLPPELRPGSRSSLDDIEEDYFSRPVKKVRQLQKRPNLNFWKDMPPEIRMHVLQFLKPKEIVRCSSVSKAWHEMCFDGQLWANLDVSQYYREIPAPALVNIITSAGPFVRDLNLRGCVQLQEKWNVKGLVDACRNLENFSLQDCHIDRTSIHCFLLQNSRLMHINLSGLGGATNSAMKIIGQHCPKVEYLNISWCENIDTRGIRKVVEGCPDLKDLRAGETKGWDNVDFVLEIFKRNTLERLLLNHCDSLTDETLTTLMTGVDSETDVLTGRKIVPPRKLKHLDLTRCRSITDEGLKSLPHNVPHLEGLQLAHCPSVTDLPLIDLFPTIPNLTHLDLESLEELTNATLQALATSPCHTTLTHLSISYCENLGDAGMIPVLKSCSYLEGLEMDNTRISDLVLTEAAAMLRARNRGARGLTGSMKPTVGLRIVAYDCANVTWTGVREILSRNAEVMRHAPDLATPTHPREIISLRCFYSWQQTVDEHTKRVMRGRWQAARDLERKWANWMMLNEEAGVGGANSRRRRRRAREAREAHRDDVEEETGVGRGGRRRARSGPGGCVIM